MKKNFLILVLLVLGGADNVFAHKKKAKKTKELLTVQSAYFANVQHHVKNVGRIFEINVTTLVPDIIIDSVWFGATPVPCDVHETKYNHRVTNPLARGKYMIKANQDLYKNFYRNIDSTNAYNSFTEPFPFKGEMVLMYLYKGKRYYKTILSVNEKPQKPLRDKR